MKTETESALLRRDLESVLSKWRRLPPAPPGVLPKPGWLRVIRESLGMTGQDFAAMLKVSQAAVTAMEGSEAAGTIQLNTLRKAAKALKCEVVYALVPKQPLDTILEQRRRSVALLDLAPMLPGTLGPEFRDLITSYAKTIKRKRVWRA